MSRLESPTLEGAYVRLEPLSIDHVDALSAAGLDPGIWRWMPVQLSDREGMRLFVEEALETARIGSAIPLVTMLRETGQVVGATRFLNIAVEHRRLEIGGTWITPAFQRTRVNTEAKYLMLRHAFEVWGCQRVEFKTNALNARSRAAILRLGAVEEGTFRKHMLNADGSVRDSVFFSIVDEEWPVVKRRLEGALKGQQGSKGARE